MTFYRSSRRRVQKDCGTVMMTKQSHKDECDIHRILRQFQKTGIITHVQSARPSYEDLPDAMDFQQALMLLDESRDVFMSLPATVRDHFQNDPSRFLGAFSDPTQEDYLRSVGLLNAKPAQRGSAEAELKPEADASG